MHGWLYAIYLSLSVCYVVRDDVSSKFDGLQKNQSINQSIHSSMMCVLPQFLFVCVLHEIISRLISATHLTSLSPTVYILFLMTRIGERASVFVLPTSLSQSMLLLPIEFVVATVQCSWLSNRTKTEISFNCIRCSIFFSMKDNPMEASNTIRLVRELRILDELAIKTLDQLFNGKLNDDLVESLVAGKEAGIALGLFKVATSSASNVRGFVLRFMADLSQVSHTFAKEFSADNAVSVYGAEPAAVFLDFAIQSEDKVEITSAALHLAASTIRHATGSLARFEATLQRFFAHIAKVLQGDLHVNQIAYPIHACAQLVRRKALRPYFLDCNIIPLLPRVLTDACATDSAALIQLSYEALLICWMLSFEYPCVVALHKVKIIPTIHRVLQRLQKEKCIRVALMTLRNFAEAQLKYYNMRHGAIDLGLAESLKLHTLGEVNNGTGPKFFADMIGVGLLKTLWQLARRKFGDEDISKEVEEMTSLLDQNVEHMSSFTEYKGEVESGILEWSPVHTSTKFWKENAGKFEDNNYEVLGELRKLILTTTHNDLTLAVALHDVGELVRHHPSGRALLQLPQLADTKEKIMHLMSHPNAEVSKNALLAVQKIMVQRWEFIK